MHDVRRRETEQRTKGNFKNYQSRKNNEADDPRYSKRKKLICPTGMYPKWTERRVSCQERTGTGHCPAGADIHVQSIASGKSFLEL